MKRTALFLSVGAIVMLLASGAMATQPRPDETRCDDPTWESNCCEPRPNETGCDDPICEEAVCGIDPFCCHVFWDDLCAVTSGSLCPEVCPSGGTMILTSLPGL